MVQRAAKGDDTVMFRTMAVGASSTNDPPHHQIVEHQKVQCSCREIALEESIAIVAHHKQKKKALIESVKSP
jgi:hypothetical protein